MVIGDSFAFGWGVSDSQTYSARLEAALPALEVINLGVGGYGTDQMLLMLREEGLRYAPDLVIAGVVAPDSPQSGMGHAVTFSRILRLHPFEFGRGIREARACSGTPVDCVKLAVAEVFLFVRLGDGSPFMLFTCAPGGLAGPSLAGLGTAATAAFTALLTAGGGLIR